MTLIKKWTIVFIWFFDISKIYFEIFHFWISCIFSFHICHYELSLRVLPSTAYTMHPQPNSSETPAEGMLKFPGDTCWDFLLNSSDFLALTEACILGGTRDSGWGSQVKSYALPTILKPGQATQAQRRIYIFWRRGIMEFDPRAPWFFRSPTKLWVDFVFHSWNVLF